MEAQLEGEAIALRHDTTPRIVTPEAGQALCDSLMAGWNAALKENIKLRGDIEKIREALRTAQTCLRAAAVALEGIPQ